MVKLRLCDCTLHTLQELTPLEEKEVARVRYLINPLHSDDVQVPELRNHQFLSEVLALAGLALFEIHEQGFHPPLQLYKVSCLENEGDLTVLDCDAELGRCSSEFGFF